MTNDYTSAEPLPEQDHSTAETRDQKQQGSGSWIKKITRTLLKGWRHLKKIGLTLLKGWRALAFLLIALIVGSYALHYKALSDPGSESKQLANNAPQEIDIFVSDPRISIGLSVAMEPWLSNQDGISIALQAPASIKSGSVLVLTSDRPPLGCTCTAMPVYQLTDPIPINSMMDPEQRLIHGWWAALIPLNFFTGPIGQREYGLGTFSLSRSDLEQTKSELYGHLPAVGPIDQSAQAYAGMSCDDLPAILAELYKNIPRYADEVRDVFLSPIPRELSPNGSCETPKLSSYETPHRGPGLLFWAPAKLSITETEAGLATMIRNQPVDYMSPSGQIDNQDYVWHGTTYLEPTFETTDGGASQKESDSAFLSGVLFGVAGAAGIAFVQEIPETFSRPVWWSRRKRKRRSSSKTATDEKPDSTKSEKQEADAKPSINTSKSSTGLGWPSSG